MCSFPPIKQFSKVYASVSSCQATFTYYHQKKYIPGVSKKLSVYETTIKNLEKNHKNPEGFSTEIASKWLSAFTPL